MISAKAIVGQSPDGSRGECLPRTAASDWRTGLKIQEHHSQATFHYPSLNERRDRITGQEGGTAVYRYDSLTEQIKQADHQTGKLKESKRGKSPEKLLGACIDDIDSSDNQKSRPSPPTRPRSTDGSSSGGDKYLGPALNLRPRREIKENILRRSEQPEEFFEGEIINTMWCAPYNPVAVADNLDLELDVATLRAGQVIAKTRYMVVMKILNRNLICLPIWTHRGNGPSSADDHIMLGVSERDNPTDHPSLDYHLYGHPPNEGFKEGTAIWVPKICTIPIQPGNKISRCGKLEEQSMVELRQRAASLLLGVGKVESWRSSRDEY